MKLVCLGSGSSGNAYVLKTETQNILIECGLKVVELIKRLIENNLSLKDISAVITTHGHHDHIEALDDLYMFGIDIYTPYKDILPKTITIGKLKVYCFKVSHDVDACGFAFIEDGSLLFINDTGLFGLEEKLTRYSFDIVAIECNHLRTKLEELKIKNPAKCYKYDRQALYHLSLLNTKKILKSLALANTKEIYLMHLSKEASDPEIMKDQIQKQFDIETHVCLEKGGTL